MSNRLPTNMHTVCDSEQPMQTPCGEPGSSPLFLLSLPEINPDVKQPADFDSEAYAWAANALAPLLSRLGEVQKINRPESRLDLASATARGEKRQPMHISFLPLDLVYVGTRAPNMAFVYCDSADIPNRGFANNPRHNWVRIANQLDLILTATPSMRESFLAAGVTAPVHVVTVPVDPRWADVRAWDIHQQGLLNAPAVILPQNTTSNGPEDPWAFKPVSPIPNLPRYIYKKCIEPLLPDHLDTYIRSVIKNRRPKVEKPKTDYLTSQALGLQGVTYTACVDPFDSSYNWKDVVTSFVDGLYDRPEATLVLQFLRGSATRIAVVDEVLEFYARVDHGHRCRIALLTDELNATQTAQLMQATTYYIDCTEREGACLNLQRYLTAGRPAIAVGRRATDEYFSDRTGFVVQSHRAPASWPRDPSQRFGTSRQRIDWESLTLQLRRSCTLAEQNDGAYFALAEECRRHMARFSAESTWPELQEAINALGRRRRAADHASRTTQFSPANQLPLAKAI